MKRLPITLIFIFSIGLSGWSQLTYTLNAPRIGDKPKWLQSQQFIPIQNNDSLLCDLSSIDFNNNGITRYSLFQDSLLLKNEMRQVAEYSLSSDTLRLLSVRKPGLNMNYIIPEVSMVYLFNDTTLITGYYYAEGKDGAGHYVRDLGRYNRSITGHGYIITPDCDSLLNVTQVSYTRYGATLISDDFSISFSNSRDSALITPTTIDHQLATDSMRHHITHNLWYAQGYRYPIIDSRQYILSYYNTPIDTTEVTLYYAPQFQEYELESDAANELIRQQSTELYYNSNINYSRAINSDDSDTQDSSGITSLTSTSCSVSPTSVTSSTTIYIDIEQTSVVSITLHNYSGTLLWNYENNFNAGHHKINCDMSNYISGNYIIFVTINNVTFSYKLIKP